MSGRKINAQVAMEFVILIGVLFFVMLLFLAFIRNYMVDVRSDKDREILKDIAYAVQAEIHIAIGVSDGYERDFTIPFNVDSTNYTINITGSQIWARTQKAEMLLNIPLIVGNLTKGGNTIRKTGGVVYLNVGVENDTEPPLLTLLSPSDGETDTDGDIVFTYRVTDIDSGIVNCTLIFDGIENQTAIGVVEGLSEYFYLDNVSIGSHNWTINCTDNSPNNNSVQEDFRDLEVVLLYNDPPTTPTSIKCDGLSCNATFSDVINITCGGSTDPDNDSITYYVDAFYASGTFVRDTVQAESGSFSFTGGYANSALCTCSSPSGTCIQDDTYSAGTWASAAYTSAYGSTVNRVTVRYCSESDGDDEYQIYSEGVQKSGWTTSYESNEWEYVTIDDVDLSNAEDLEINCSRDTVNSYCRVDYVIFDNRTWQNIGTHSEGGNIDWNISSYPNQTNVDLRCRATDVGYSNLTSSNYDPATNMVFSSGGVGGGASGATVNSEFNTSAAGWTGADWDLDAFEVDPDETYQSTGGDPDGRIVLSIPAGKLDQVGGYWEQDFEVTVNNPDNATCRFGWKVDEYEATPITFQLYVFLDTVSGAPTIGQEVWASGEQTSTSSWTDEVVDCTSEITAAGTYYYKLAVWVETDGGDNDGPYTISIDNAEVTWFE